MCNQRSLMAPHYAKRQAKGAWHFLSRRTKNQERPVASCRRAHFLLPFVGRCDAATADVVTAAAVGVFPGGGDATAGTYAATRTRRQTKDTTRLGFLGTQRTARARAFARRALSLRFLSLPPLPPFHPLHVSDTTGVSMYPIYRRATLPPPPPQPPPSPRQIVSTRSVSTRLEATVGITPTRVFR